jgi:hypothetical protein
MPAELVLAAIGAADLCLKYGKKLVRTYNDLKDSVDNVKALVLVIEAIWNRTEVQIEFLKKVAGTFCEEHLQVQQQVLAMLQSKLLVAITKIESLLNSGQGSPVKKLKYVAIKDTLEEAISELERWQRIFDPTWYLVLLIGDALIDSELGSLLPPSSSSTTLRASSPTSTFSTAKNLRETMKGDKRNVTLSEGGLDWTTAQPIGHSDSRLVRRTRSEKLFILNTITCDSGVDMSMVRDDARRLASTLHEVDPATFGLLSCHGQIKRKNKETGLLESIDLVFQFPPDVEPTQNPSSLRSHLLDMESVSLTEVLNIARQMARATSFIHSCDFVHKNIRPETILLFVRNVPRLSGGVKPTLSAYLVGFDSFRSTRFQTMRSGDSAWERNLYRHPLRQGLLARETYAMHHDVYSLGVCLLELGLRATFVTYKTSPDTPIAGPNCSNVPSAVLGLTLDDFSIDASADLTKPTNIKSHLVEMAKAKLPRRMGDEYTDIVVRCLCCLDEGNQDFAGDNGMRDEDGILIGVKFIEQILLSLNDIRL